jgi:hypothetical protein
MPNLDGTGPEGRGPLTGRRRGRCRNDKKNQADVSENKSRNEDEIFYESGHGKRPRGRGRGRGFRRQ